MRRGGMFRKAQEASGSSARNGTGSPGSKGKPDDRPTWPAAPSGAEGRSRRAHVSGLPVPCLRHGFGFGGTSVWKRRRLSLPRWRRGDRGSKGLAGQPAGSAGRRTGNRASAGPEAVLRKALRATGGPDGTAGGGPCAGKAGGDSGRVRRATGGSDGTTRGRPRGGPAGGAPPTGPKGNRRTQRDGGRATVRRTGRTQLSGRLSGRPVGQTERQAGDRLPGRPGARLREGRPGNRRAGRNDGRATA